LLAEASLPLVEEANEALRTTLAWLKRVNQQRSMFRGIMKRQTDAKLQVEGAKSLVERADGLDQALHAYRTSLRFKTMEPYLHLFDPSHPPSDDIDYRKLPHRALFWDCLATYHLVSEPASLPVQLLLTRHRYDGRWSSPAPSSPRCARCSSWTNDGQELASGGQRFPSSRYSAKDRGEASSSRRTLAVKRRIRSKVCRGVLLDGVAALIQYRYDRDRR
jgi:hypothetical protein